jgi:hypothetical protein
MHTETEPGSGSSVPQPVTGLPGAVVAQQCSHFSTLVQTASDCHRNSVAAIRVGLLRKVDWPSADLGVIKEGSH